MKLAFQNGAVVAIAESMEDVATLQKLTKKVYKKTTGTYLLKDPQTCECGKVCRGYRGLTIHKTKCLTAKA